MANVVKIRGNREIIRAIREAQDTLAPLLLPVVDAAAHLALAVSRPLVPVDTGGLAASGRVKPGHMVTPTTPTASVEYKDPDGSAAYVHEGVHGRFKKSGPPKFLRIGFVVARRAFRKNVIQTVEKALARSFKQTRNP